MKKFDEHFIIDYSYEDFDVYVTNKERNGTSSALKLRHYNKTFNCSSGDLYRYFTEKSKLFQIFEDFLRRQFWYGEENIRVHEKLECLKTETDFNKIRILIEEIEHVLYEELENYIGKYTNSEAEKMLFVIEKREAYNKRLKEFEEREEQEKKEEAMKLIRKYGAKNDI